MAPSIPNRPALCGCGNPTHSPLTPCPPGPLSPEREAEIREIYLKSTVTTPVTVTVPELLAEIRRLHDELDRRAERIAELESAMAAEPRATDGAVDALSRAVQDVKGGVA